MATEKDKWRIIADKSSNVRLEVQDPDGWYDASVKWDGCIDFRRYKNAPLDDPDRSDELDDVLHICELDDEIERLQALRAVAVEHFGQGWLVGEYTPLGDDGQDCKENESA
jgi:hypothetical protein